MEHKPLISFILLTYNQEDFVRDALEGAFAQTYSPLEIIIADDGSKDNTPKVIEDTIAKYIGPHKVIFNRNEKNVGIAQNVNRAMSLASGEYFVLAAGDDKSLPERVQRTYEIFARYPEITCINFNSIQCDSSLTPLQEYRIPSPIQSLSMINIYDYCEFASFVIWSGDVRSIRRTLYDTFEPLVKGGDEDSSYFFRGLLLGAVGHSQERQSFRRIHTQQASNWQNIKKHDSEDFIAQPLLDIQKALSLGLISHQTAGLFEYKIKCADRILADQYYESTSKWYRLLCSKPANLLRRIKNKLFK